MTDFTIRMYPGKPTALVSSAIIGSLMAAGLYEGSDYDLIRSEPTDPLAVETTGDEASSKHLYFMDKLHDTVRQKFMLAGGEFAHDDAVVIANTLAFIQLELQDGTPNKRRASAIIDALKDIERMIG